MEVTQFAFTIVSPLRGFGHLHVVPGLPLHGAQDGPALGKTRNPHDFSGSRASALKTTTLRSSGQAVWGTRKTDAGKMPFETLSKLLRDSLRQAQGRQGKPALRKTKSEKLGHGTDGTCWQYTSARFTGATSPPYTGNGFTRKLPLKSLGGRRKQARPASYLEEPGAPVRKDLRDVELEAE